MAVSIRALVKPTRAELSAINARLNVFANALLGYPLIANGGTAGRFKTTNAATFKVDGATYSKAITDDLWNLSAETTLGAAAYKAYWLYIDASGTASIEAGTASTTAALALSLLPVPSVSKCVFGVFVAAPLTNFANALSAQGTIYQGIPVGACIIPNSPRDQVGIASVINLLAP